MGGELISIGFARAINHVIESSYHGRRSISRRAHQSRPEDDEEEGCRYQKSCCEKKNGKVKAAAAKKKPALKKIAAIKTGRNSIRKSAIGGRSKAMGGGRAVGMAIDQVVRGTGGRRATNSARVTPNKATNDAPTKLLVSNLDFNVTEKDIKVCSNDWTPRRQTTRGEETIQNNFEEKKRRRKTNASTAPLYCEAPNHALYFLCA